MTQKYKRPRGCGPFVYEGIEMTLSVLLVEDDMDLAASLVDYLEIKGVACDHAFSGDQGLDLARKEEYDVLLLDVQVPGINGFNLCETLRREGVMTPVLMLTALDSMDDKAAGFYAGTDDYLVKPFVLQEMYLRVLALSNRRSSLANKFEIADLKIDLKEYSVHRGSRRLHLTPTEWKLLKVLVCNSPDIVTRKKLEHAVWGHDVPVANSLKVHLHKLRRKIDSPEDEPLLHTLPSVGVVLRK